MTDAPDNKGKADTKSTTAKGKAARQEVTLKKAHEHAGKSCAVGDKILVNEHQHAFLKARGII